MEGHIGTFTAIAAVMSYGTALFAIAIWFDRRGISPRFGRLAYALSLAVYCSSWTFFGGVGTAATTGWTYLSIYLGPILLFLFAPRFLARIVRLSREAGSTSIADFISARYGRSQSIAAIVASFALISSIPYIALQLRSVSASFAALVGIAHSTWLGPLTAALLAIFAISFGARRYDVAGRNQGLIAVIASESVVKLFSFAALGIFALVLFSRAPATIQARGSSTLAAHFRPGDLSIEFVVQTLLSAFAIFCLPRQFYVGVIQAEGVDPVRSARWPLILYLTAVSVLVLPLALAGLTLLPGSVAPDLIVLNLPLVHGSGSVALLAFIGGFSAATAMVVAETIALSTMATNDLLAPLLLRIRPGGGEADLGRLMLSARRIIIVAIIAVALFYGQSIESGHSLASIGLIAFSGVAQFAPALVASVSFDFNDARAARAGLLGGLLAWAYCLLLPSIGGTGINAALTQASSGLLDPQALGGIDLGSPLVNGCAWSIGLNISLMLLFRYGSLRPLLSEKRATEGGFGFVVTMGQLKSLVARFVGDAQAADSFDEMRTGPNTAGDPNAPIGGPAARLAERLIAGVIGASSARMIVTSAMAGASLEVGDVVRLLDHSGQSLQFSRTLLSGTLAAIDPGVSVVDSNLRLVAWNPRYLEMFEYPADYVVVGRPVADLIRYNAERGECGPGEVEQHVERRLTHMRRGSAHSFERQRPSGRWIKTVGRSMPRAGYVMSFTDITTEKDAQTELEARVEARTRDLEAINIALAEAKTAAELATRDKTRFLAAASHDLLQPLHAARLFCSALDVCAGDANWPLVRNIDRAIGSADSLLRALLDVSRLDSGGIVPRPARFDVGTLIDELVAEFAPSASERGLTLHAHPGHFIVETDRLLLRSILQNFLSNAVCHTASGRVWIGARRRERQVLVEVRDTGPGIAERDQNRIFREFERLETPGSGGGGVGLGLAIVERTARLLGASLSVRSAIHRGSTFAVAIAIASGEWPTHLPRPAPDLLPEVDVAGLIVLCLDNDPLVLEALGVALRARGCVALLTATTHQAIDCASQAPPEAALIDFHLDNGPDGLDVAAVLRTKYPGLAIALVTADSHILDDPRFQAIGVTLLPKPVNPARLWQWLQAAARTPV